MGKSESFQCRVCGKSFSVPQAALDKYPGWKPSVCRDCRGDKGKKGTTASPRARSAGRGQGPLLSPDEVLERYDAGPKTGIFTDGSASPNPGPGGWGVVYVVDDEIIDAKRGTAPQTTNNRMELQALIEGYKMASRSVEMDVYSDSELCVKTINEWAAAWEARGWKRKGGPIKNLELVQELYALSKTRPNLRLRWIKAHDGSRWNEYADALASTFLRERR